MGIDEVHFRNVEQRLWHSVGVAPTERRLQLARHSCAVRVQEVGEGPAVLFVHGASNGGSSWASLVARLDGFRCILLDRPGCGLSDPLAARIGGIDELERYADTLIPDVLDALELASAHVIATSYGGYFALARGSGPPGPHRASHRVQLDHRRTHVQGATGHARWAAHR